MANYDLFWQSYVLLERELIEISNVILFDDNNINTYSLKIADLIMRVNVEIEALAKQLHVDNGGAPASNGQFLVYDAECLKFLDQSWELSKKIVTVVFNMSFFTKIENKTLRPLKNAHKQGSAGPYWKQAYQALKHDRANSIDKATLRSLIGSMAALFLLNVYHKNFKEEIGTLINKQNVDLTFGSNFFAVDAFEENKFDYENLKLDNQDVKESTILVYPKQEDVSKLRKLEADFHNVRVQKIVDELNKSQEDLSSIAQASDPQKALTDRISKRLSQTLAEDFKKYGHELHRFTPTIKYVAELNKNQFKTPSPANSN